MDFKCKIYVGVYAQILKQQKKVFVQETNVTECEQNCVLNTEAACEDQVIAALWAKSAVSRILPSQLRLPSIGFT